MSFRSSVVLLALVCAAPWPAGAQQVERGEWRQVAMTIPGNLEAGPLAADLRVLIRLSATFRGQCERIAGDPRLRVRVSLAYAVDGGARARTTFHRYRSGVLIADVELLFGDDYRELLAHEFEHVIEQIDGVDLREEAAAGRAWELAGGAFETRRALVAGLRVRREAAARLPAVALAPVRATR